MYAYRHKIVFRGKLESGTPSAKITVIEQSDLSKQNPEQAEILDGSIDDVKIIEQLRTLHAAVIRAKTQSIKMLIS